MQVCQATSQCDSHQLGHWDQIAETLQLHICITIAITSLISRLLMNVGIAPAGSCLVIEK